MRSSTKSENCSDNVNNNNMDEDREKSSTDDIIDISNNESNKKTNTTANCESESNLRSEPVESEKTKVNVYEQVRRGWFLSCLNHLDMQIRLELSVENESDKETAT